MKMYWPHRADGLPPGQRLMTEMPRFTEKPLAPPPSPLPDFGLTISIDSELVAQLDKSDFEALGPRTFEADFHCVTTWSVAGLTWTGVPLREVVTAVGLDIGTAPYLIARAHDRRRGHFLIEDALAEDVIVATHLNGEPLDARHGGPLRLVAPQQYGYKSIKHLASIDFRASPPTRLGLEHLRGRLALQERHPKLPSWLVEYPYRMLIPPTAYLAERALARQQRLGAAVTACRPATNSLAASLYQAPDYLDCFVIEVRPGRFNSVDDVATAWFTEQPGWLRMVSTNTLTKSRVVEAITAGQYRTGTQVGSWQVIDRNDDEIVFGDDMGFMQYRFSFRLATNADQIEATTTVKYLWPRTGRLYFALVRPFHQRFIKLLLHNTSSGASSRGDGLLWDAGNYV